MTEPTTLLKVSPELLDAAEDNPRTDLGDLEGLVASIREVGILEPIIVTPGSMAGRFTIVAGHRRHAAAVMAGAVEIEVIVQAVDGDADRQRMMLIENLHREDLSVLDKARGFKALADSGLSQRDIAARVGIGQATVSKHLSLLKLPAAVQEWVVDGQLSQEAATQIAGLPAEARAELVKNGIPAGWRIDQAVRKAEGEKRYASALKKLQAAGTVLLDNRPSAWIEEEADSDPVAISAFGDLSHVDAGEHAGLDCHAVWLAQDGTSWPACTAPSGHPAPEPTEDETVTVGEIETPEAKGRRITIERFLDELDAATIRRRAWLAGLAASFPMLLVASIRLMSHFQGIYLDAEMIMELLGPEPIKGAGMSDGRLADVLAAAKSDTHARRVLFLSFASMGEQVFDARGPGRQVVEASPPEAADGEFYLDVLAGLGYEPSRIECKYLGVPFEEPQMPGTASPAAEEGASDAEVSELGPGPGPAENRQNQIDELNAEAIAITIEAKKGRHYIRCSECGHVGFNTREDLARQRVDVHRREHEEREASA